MLAPTGEVLTTDALAEHLRPAVESAAAPRADGRLGVWLTQLQAHQQYLVRVEAFNSLGGSPLPDDAGAYKFLSASARTLSSRLLGCTLFLYSRTLYYITTRVVSCLLWLSNM